MLSLLVPMLLVGTYVGSLALIIGVPTDTYRDVGGRATQEAKAEDRGNQSMLPRGNT